MEIRIDDLEGPEIRELLEEHLQRMYETSPPESVHALDLEALKKPEITFWTVWEDNLLAGCGALKELDRAHGEIKSMKTSDRFLRRGVGSLIVRHILDVARERGYRRISLETGSMSAFGAALALYKRFGFVECGPFDGYVEDPNSVFMTKIL
ncbi:MAG: GNAT family N-acetyltransferase [Acidobacteria bacterium]|nr:MAG: GNAT family N-acetyltransferase [Acidobacteriota bacterium]REK03062.1 MAG: GNAT family N-acetyltransferase [Acidobacteriota bacterium]REK13134.1 MAG: GNAT family N-acetyltransferase [Acidobacteriota bacterium]REK41128.1 MAG: GNAT family N-acetyltransferase [Acidobacteriota bacterium]